MGRSIQRKTVYAATLITVLALAGAWTFAATLVTSPSPGQSSSITVVEPTPLANVTVQSTELVAVTGAIAASPVAGTQAPTGSGGLNSSSTIANAVLPTCTATASTCGGNYSAVDVATPLTVGDIAVQVSLQVGQVVRPWGFDVQVEIILVGSPNTYVFGNGYFDTGANTAPATVWVMLFVDTGVSALTPPSIDHVVITMNACIHSATCP